MKEKLGEHSTISIDQTLEILKDRISGSKKSVLVVSDLDGTLANNHKFDSILNVHVPQINNNLVEATTSLAIPLLIATGRPDSDPTLPGIWQLLSHHPMPIIMENGGVIIDPIDGKVTTTISTVEFNVLRNVTTNLPNLASELHANLLVPLNHEILIDNTRKTSIEIRIQDRQTKIGSTKIHELSCNFLKEKIKSNELSIISSGSSISILPHTISKGRSILDVLKKLEIERSDIFIVALGDADNDQSMFDIADLGIGVDVHTIGKSEITCLGGENTSIEVIKAIGKLRI